MPLVFIVFCSSVGSQSNIAHSTVHKMQCTKSFRKIHDMHISKLSSSNSGNACVVQRVQYSSYCTMNIFTFLWNAIHTACSAPYVQVGSYQHGKISQVHYWLHIQSTSCFVFFSQQRFFFLSNFSQQRLNSRLSMCFTTMRMKDLTYSNQHVYKLEISFRQRINKSTLTPMSLKLVILKLLSREGLSCLN